MLERVVTHGLLRNSKRARVTYRIGLCTRLTVFLPSGLHGFLLQKRADDFEELFRRLRLCGRRFLFRIEDVAANMAVDDLDHQAVQRSSARGDGLQNREAIVVVILFELALNPLDLAADLLDPEDQLLAVAHGVSHVSEIPWGGILVVFERAQIEGNTRRGPR